MSVDTSFLSKPLRRVAALLIAAGMLVGLGAAGLSQAHAIAAEEAVRAVQPTRDVIGTRLDDIAQRLDRIERKLDAP